MPIPRLSSSVFFSSRALMAWSRFMLLLFRASSAGSLWRIIQKVFLIQKLKPACTFPPHNLLLNRPIKTWATSTFHRLFCTFPRQSKKLQLTHYAAIGKCLFNSQGSPCLSAVWWDDSWSRHLLASLVLYPARQDDLDYHHTNQTISHYNQLS